MAIFPTSVAGDSDLYIAVNNKVTNLTAGISSSDLTIPVTSTTGFPASGFITIDNEIIHYTSVGAFQFNADVRGADGTAAVSHLNAAQVNLDVIAAHHNALKDEIKAIEQNISDRLGLSSTQNIIPVGSVSAPSLAFLGDLNTGMYHSNTDEITFGTGGNQALALGNTFILGYHPFLGVDGTQAAPSITFASESGTGISHESPGYISFVYNNTALLRLRGTSNDARFSVDAVSPGHSNLGTSTDYWGKLYVSGIVGTTTNNNAATGDVGETVRSAVSAGSAITLSTSGQFFNVTSITLSAGDWDITGIVSNTVNTATVTTGIIGALSTNSGNTTTDHVAGDNEIQSMELPGAIDASVVIPSFRVSLSSSTTYYLKGKGYFSSGTEKSYGRISARRVR